MYDKIKRLHFVGIGGIGMSGIAEVLVNLGYQVSGTDTVENANVQRLRGLGVTVWMGHAAARVANVDAVVYSSAVKRDNPELEEARRLRIPVVPRAEMLAELMRLKRYGVAVAGTHGKTTTTSLVATVLAQAGLDPTVVNGGILKAFGSNAHLGQGDFLVAEADESDGSFLKLNPTIAVVTNIDPEHMEFYGEFNAVRRAFREFTQKIPFYGLAVLNRDHPETAALQTSLSDKRVATFGFHERADYRAEQLRVENGLTCFQVVFQERGGGRRELLGELALGLPGRHNVSNALAAVVVAQELAIPWAVTAHALANCHGVQRRFDLLHDAPELTVIDDYGHHPVEIRATLQAARDRFGADRRVVALFQPHRYSRVKSLLDEFCHAFAQADLVLVDRIYPAGEKPMAEFVEDGGQLTLMEGIERHSRTRTGRLPAGEGWRQELHGLLQAGDVVLFLGAGDISRRAHEFAAWLQG